jgi:hypothetical protein
MIRLFLDNRTAVLLLLPFIIGVYALGSVFSVDQGLIHRSNGLFFHSEVAGGFWTYFLQSFLILANAVLLNAVFNSHEFLDKNTYIISLIYVVMTPMFVPLNQFSPVLFAHFFLIATLSIVFQLKQNTDGKMTVFNAGILLSFAMIFLPYLLLLIPIILIMNVVIRPFLWRELFLCLAGMSLPLIYYLSYLFLSDQFQFTWAFPVWKLHNVKTALNEYPMVGFFFVLLFISLFSLGARMLKSSLRLKKQIQMLGLLFSVLIVIGSIDFYLSGTLLYLSLAIIPLSYFLTYAFLSKRSGILANIFFYLTALYSFVKFFISFT